jgi:hypothetical protein
MTPGSTGHAAIATTNQANLFFIQILFYPGAIFSARKTRSSRTLRELKLTHSASAQSCLQGGVGCEPPSRHRTEKRSGIVSAAQERQNAKMILIAILPNTAWRVYISRYEIKLVS